MSDFKKLIVWQRAQFTAAEVYRVTRTWHREDRWTLGSQMFRAAFSVPFNVAEGNGRRSDREQRRFLIIARSSSKELESQLLLALDLELMDQAAFDRIAAPLYETQRMLTGMINRLERRLGAAAILACAFVTTLASGLWHLV